MPHRIHPLLEERTAGVLLHPTSLPGARGTAGVGDLGPAARKFCDWMHRAGLKRWQMLPIGPVGAGDSPPLRFQASRSSPCWLPCPIWFQMGGCPPRSFGNRMSRRRLNAGIGPLGPGLASTSFLCWSRPTTTSVNKADGVVAPARSSKPFGNATRNGSTLGQTLPSAKPTRRVRTSQPSLNTTPLCSGSWTASGKHCGSTHTASTSN